MPLLPVSELTAALFACTGLVALLTAVFVCGAARGMPAFARPLHLWAMAMLCTGAVAFGLLVRHWLPGAVGYVVPNLAVLGAAALLGSAAASLPGGSMRRARRGWWLAGLVAGLLVLGQALQARYAVLALTGSLGLGLLHLHAAWVFLPQLRERPRGFPEAWVLGALLVLGVGFLLRALAFALNLELAVARWAPGYPLLMLNLVFVASASLAFCAMLHERQRLALQHSYQRDSLTGLYTRGAFFEKAQAMLQQAEAGEAFTVLMVDLDHFKRINDTHGHLVGDKVIAHAARVLHGTTRLTDLAGRYGGEEFCLLLHGCDAERARRFAQRLLRGADQPVDMRDGRRVPFSFSVGFVALRRGRDAPALESLIDRADQALLQAKARGRKLAVEAVAGPAGQPCDFSAS